MRRQQYAIMEMTHEETFKNQMSRPGWSVAGSALTSSERSTRDIADFRSLCGIRQVAPDIILTQYPYEYMEDHSNTCRAAVTAAFCRGMKNFPVEPDVKPISKPLTLYHSFPYGLTDPLRRPVKADFYVDVASFIENKAEMLARHASQKEWLDVSQGLDAYLIAMKDMCAEVGKLSGQFDYAEGWIRHSHLGFCDKDDNPLAEITEKTG